MNEFTKNNWKNKWHEWIDTNELNERLDMNELTWKNWNEGIEMKELKWIGMKDYNEWVHMKKLKEWMS